MKVKGIVSEEKVTLPEVREILLRVESERIAAEKEKQGQRRRGRLRAPSFLPLTTSITQEPVRVKLFLHSLLVT